MRQENKMKETDQQVAMRVSGVSILVNVVLSLFKLLAGIIARSGAMISDAIHSASDVASTVVVIIGVNMAGKKSDKEHQYGHERLECVSSILLAGLLMITGAGIGISGIQKIIDGTSGKDLMVPGMLALVAAVVSLIVKEWMFWYTRAAAKKINSGALMADAWHHRSDALSSVGSLLGIGGAMLGFPVLDAVASVVICLFILKVAFDVLKDSVKKMLDTSCGDFYEKKLSDFILMQQEVLGIDMLHTRMFGNRVYADLEIRVDGNKSLREAHAIAENVHNQVIKDFPSMKDIMIHVHPEDRSGEKEIQEKSF